MKKINLFTPIMLVFDGNYIHKTICKHLMNQGICSLMDLCMHSEEYLQAFKGIKEKSIETIQTILAEYELSLDMDEGDIAKYVVQMPPIQFPKKDSTPSKIDWEQRRYEIAKDAYVVLITDISQENFSANTIAQSAVEYADCLLLQLQTIQMRNKTR